MPALPATVLTNLPGRLVARTGFSAQIPGAALRLGEMAYTTDDHKFWVGDESNAPPWIPTSKFEGTLDWSKIDLTLKSLQVTNINGKTAADFITTTVINTGQVFSIVNDNVSKNIYGSGADFPGILEAYAWLSQRTIAQDVLVTLNLPSGIVPESRKCVLRHPNGDKIVIMGATLKSTMPEPAQLQITGSNITQQNADNAANLSRLRLSLATEWSFTTGGSIFWIGNLGRLQNVLVTADGTNKPGIPATDIVTFGNGAAYFNNVAVSQGNYRGCVVAGAASLTLAEDSYNYFFGNKAEGIATAYYSSVGYTHSKLFIGGNGSGFNGSGIYIGAFSSCLSLPFEQNADVRTVFVCGGNSGFGVEIKNGTANLSVGAVITMNGVAGIGVQQGFLTVFKANISGSNIGVYANVTSFVTMEQSTVTAIQTGIYADNKSTVSRTGASVSAPTPYSPALNSTGNNGSNII